MATTPRTTSIGLTFLWALGAFALFGLLVVLWFRANPASEKNDYKRGTARLEKLQTLQHDEHEKLSAPPAFVDKEKGVVRIPIERAIDLAVNDLQKKTMRTSKVKVEVPYLDGLSAPPIAAPTGSPSPSASPAVKPAPEATPKP